MPPHDRERHRYECETRGRSVSSKKVDADLAEVIGAIRLDRHMIDASVDSLRIERGGGIDLDELDRRATRAHEVYLNGGLDRARYELILSEVQAQLAQTDEIDSETISKLIERLEQIDSIWARASSEQRCEIVAELIDRAYIDVSGGRIGAIVPQPAVGALMERALVAGNSGVKLVHPSEFHRSRDVVELVDLRGLEPLASPPETWFLRRPDLRRAWYVVVRP
ncbi:MAG: hypothetical protein O3A10_16795 [Chloroflexi bacterium]|nr:hypothetical protein [Chloroflexota bacterium]